MMHPYTHPRAASPRTMGMTVIELLVGLSIATVLMIFMVQAYVTTEQLSHRGIVRFEQLEESQLILDQIQRDLQSAVKTTPLQQFQFTMSETKKNATPQEQFSFIQLQPSTDSTNSSLVKVLYTIGTTQRIYRTETPFSDSSTQSKDTTNQFKRPVGIGLDDTNYFLEFEFFSNSTSTTSQTQWTTQWTDAKAIPALIRVHLMLKNTIKPDLNTRLSRTVQLGGSI